MTATCELAQKIPAQTVSDGAGVRIRRSLGQTAQLRFDPFLMLDEFGSENPDDYIAGFPDHPHRGFETLTYMLEGHMRHEDHLGNRGQLLSGDVQWMTAGRGIIHSEMPQQDNGHMRGFQLWLNLPAKDKMQPPAYRDIKARDIPRLSLSQGGSAIVIAGTLEDRGNTVTGPVNPPTTQPLYFDIHLDSGQAFHHALPASYHCLLYVYEGAVAVGSRHSELTCGTAGLMAAGNQIAIKAVQNNTRFLVIAGKPLNEPVAQYGPFVMNTVQEIEQALSDYRSGRLING